MRTFGQRKYMKYGIFVIALAMILTTGLATAAYNQDDSQRSQAQPGQGHGENQGGVVPMAESRDLGLERQIADALRKQGYGAQGEIMLLAAGNKVTLLGTVPTDQQKDGVVNVVKGVAPGKSIDDRLHVTSGQKPETGAALESKVYNNLGGDVSKEVRVGVQGGTATLRGHVKNWNQLADAIDAAFAAGATRVNSELTVGAAEAPTTAQAAGGAPAYGYIPGQQGAGAEAAQASPADLRLAQQVAAQLHQQLPPGQNIQLIQPQSIYISASQGTVTLRGFVQNNNERQQAEQVVRSIPGVRSIHNDLTILNISGAAAQAGGQPGGQGQSAQGGQRIYGQSGFNRPPVYGPQGGQVYYGEGPQGSASQGQYGQGEPGYGQGMYDQQGFRGQSQYGQGRQTGSGQAGTSASDMALAREVALRLHQRLPNLRSVQIMRPDTIYVMAVRGDVTLHGSVANQNIKQRAGMIAQAIPGVRNVTDTLRILGTPGGYPSYGYVPGRGYGAETRYIGEASNETESSGIQGESTTGPSQSDLAIAREVARKLHQQTGQNVQIVTPGTLYVKVNDGTVTLDGFVPTDRERDDAEQVAKSINGVRSVKNSLNIAPAGSFPSYGYIPGREQFGNQQYPYQPYQGQPYPGEQFQGQEPSQGYDQGEPY